MGPSRAQIRVHFHGFMANVHAYIHAWRQERRKGSAKGDDPVARWRMPSPKSLAFMFRRVQRHRYRRCDDPWPPVRGFVCPGVVIVATSNVRPDLLYQDGLNRALFLPFIAMIEERTQIACLETKTDFRLQKLRDHAVYFVPPDARAAAALTSAFRRLTGQERGAPMTLDVLGHAVHVPEACANVARFAFADLCRIPLGPSIFSNLRGGSIRWSSMQSRSLTRRGATKPSGSSR